MKNPNDSSKQPKTTTTMTQVSTLPVSGQPPTPSVAGDGTSITSATTNPIVTPPPPPPRRPSITRAPPIVMAADSSTARDFISGATSGELFGGGGGGRGGGVAAVSAGMDVLQIGPTSARVKAGIGSRGGRGGIRIGQRKRNREQGDAASSGSGGEMVGPPPPALVQPGGPFVCPVCRRSDFPSFQSLSGHMKIHPERNWRGINPPPVFDLDEFGDILVQFAGRAEAEGSGHAPDAFAADEGGDNVTGAGREEIEVPVTLPETAEGQGGNLAAPNFDLNTSPAKEEGELPPSSSPRKILDLNKTPSPEA